MMFWTLILAAMPLDPVGKPLPLYLDEPAVRQVLAAVPGVLSDCPAPDVTIQVTMRLTGRGEVVVDSVNGGDSQVSECMTTGLAKLDAPEHHGVDVEVRTSIYRRDGVWMISPSPEVVRRPQVPLLLFVPGDGDTGSVIWRHLVGPEEGER